MSRRFEFGVVSVVSTFMNPPDAPRTDVSPSRCRFVTMRSRIIFFVLLPDSQCHLLSFTRHRTLSTSKEPINNCLLYCSMYDK
jgi:hypothetical protein